MKQCTKCNSNINYYAKGMCKDCYSVNYEKNKRKKGVCSTCGETTYRYSCDICQPCRNRRDKPHWKGSNVGYYGLHSWVNKVLGKPRKCEHCGDTSTRKYEWANKTGNYKRDEKDWIRLCTSCHRKYDYTNGITTKIFQLP